MGSEGWKDDLIFSVSIIDIMQGIEYGKHNGLWLCEFLLALLLCTNYHLL